VTDTAVERTSESYADSEAERRKRQDFIRVLAFVVLTVVMGALVGACFGLKASYLYKKELHLTANDVTSIGLILGIPSYLQPFVGTWTDTFAFFGYHRRSYSLVSGK